MEEVNCPISGEYTGILPDAPGLCAKVQTVSLNLTEFLFTNATDLGKFHEMGGIQTHCTTFI